MSHILIWLFLISNVNCKLHGMCMLVLNIGDVKVFLHSQVDEGTQNYYDVMIYFFNCNFSQWNVKN